MSTEPEAAEAFNTWQYDSAAGGFRDVNTPDASARTLIELSGGAFTTIDNTVRDTANGRIVGNLSPVHGSTLSVGDQGSLFLNNGIAREDINQSGGRNIMQRASITVRLPETDEFAAKVIEGTTSLTHFGGGIYTVQGEPRGPGDFERVDVVPDATIPGEPRRLALPREIGLYRRATPSEVIRRSAMGWLARNALDELAARASGLGGKRQGSDIPGLADIIDALGITIEVSPFVTYDLSPEERP